MLGLSHTIAYNCPAEKSLLNVLTYFNRVCGHDDVGFAVPCIVQEINSVRTDRTCRCLCIGSCPRSTAIYIGSNVVDFFAIFVHDLRIDKSTWLLRPQVTHVTFITSIIFALQYLFAEEGTFLPTMARNKEFGQRHQDGPNKRQR